MVASFEKFSPQLFDVLLKDAGLRKIAVIKAVGETTGFGLKDSKDLVEGLDEDGPAIIARKVSCVQAEKIKDNFEAAGATISIVESVPS